MWWLVGLTTGGLLVKLTSRGGLGTYNDPIEIRGEMDVRERKSEEGGGDRTCPLGYVY